MKRTKRLRVQKDGRVRLNLTFTPQQADKIEAAAGDEAPTSWATREVIVAAERREG